MRYSCLIFEDFHNYQRKLSLNLSQDTNVGSPIYNLLHGKENTNIIIIIVTLKLSYYNSLKNAAYLQRDVSIMQWFCKCWESTHALVK